MLVIPPPSTTGCIKEVSIVLDRCVPIIKPYEHRQSLTSFLKILLHACSTMDVPQGCGHRGHIVLC